MHKVKIFIMRLICIVCCLQVTIAQTEPYIPSAPTDIIAEWDYPVSTQLRSAQTQQQLQPQNANAIAQLANEYLKQAAQLGYSRLYGSAQAILKTLIDNNSDSVAIWLAWAQVKQHQHQFTEAQQALHKVFAKDPKNIAAHLLAARIHLVQDNPQAARNACLKLFGHTDLLTMGACSLEASSQLGEKELGESYVALQQLVTTEGLPSDERQIWVLQILADMATRLNKPQDAIPFLEKVSQKNTVSYWVQWADAQLAVDNANGVLERLSALITASPDQDDALLVRLVLAEQQLSSTSHWQSVLAERIALREQRGDIQHASDLAIYYLDIDPNPQKALYWAQINIQQAREASDKRLLARAQQQHTISQTSEE